MSGGLGYGLMVLTVVCAFVLGGLATGAYRDWLDAADEEPNTAIGRRDVAAARRHMLIAFGIVALVGVCFIGLSALVAFGGTGLVNELLTSFL